ncbi:uncharacterized protein A4U43_C01F34820 [Asparagus officinalis]|uniref:Uncharacterized protein n=1 Tax=Asparagus officinalis TaxID=4686 RepID=A0A5P1FVA8_ASPOF|nr:uncharacterized protein A4U43_C01F34820 [Asparagus officinalis]
MDQNADVITGLQACIPHVKATRPLLALYKYKLKMKREQPTEVMDELYECDVVWADCENGPANVSDHSNAYQRSSRRPNSPTPRAAAPVNIPSTRPSAWSVYSDEETATTEAVPPHVLVSGRRSVGDKAAFSVCSGHGRTLKGRDLRHVRDSVLRMTGFLEG